jgi:RNA polymerase sigma-70 factor (ECF subfamily)
MKPDPMPASESLPPRALLEHATSLRRLALALVRDADAADDVVQETWVRALESPPGRLEALGGWLRTVLTHIVANRHRSEARRSSREHDVARSEVAHDSLERERTLRSVVEAVLALDEPLRTVVMLRHFEGLAPREIAERLRVPPTVVYNRLQRAHALLRTKLEREDRSWVSALALLAGANRRHWLLRTAGVSAGTLIMSVKTQVTLCAAAALMVGSFFVWRSASGASNSVAPVAASAQPKLEIPREDASARAAAAAGVDERAAVADEKSEPVATRPVPPFEYTLEFELTDADDAPLAGASVFVAPMLQPLDRAGETDGEGHCIVRWRGFVESMDVAIAASTDRDVPDDLRLVHVQAASEQHVAMRATPRSWFVSLSSSVGDGSRSENTSEVRLSASDAFGSSFQLLSGLYRMGSDAGAPQMHACADGFSYFVDPWMARGVPGDNESVTEVRGTALDMVGTGDLGGVTFAVRALRIDMGDLVVSIPSEATPHFSLNGQVLGEGDKPLGQVLVRVRRQGTHTWTSTRSDEDGNYEFAQLTLADPVGANYDLVAGDGDNGLARTMITGSDGAKLRYDARLERGRELQGRLLGSDGRPLGNWTIELSREDALAPWIDVATSDEAGNFRIPSLPRGAFTLLARPADAKGAIPMVVARNVWPTDERQEFKIAVEAFGGLHVEVVDENDKPFAGAAVRVWQSDVGRGRQLANSSTPNAFASDKLFPGTYRVEIGAPARGWTVLEQVFVKPGETVDLGRIRFAAPARLEVDASAAKENAPFRALFVHRGAQVETLSDAFESQTALAIELAAGEYEHAPRFEELAHTDKLTLHAGESRALDLRASKSPSESPGDQ